MGPDQSVRASSERASASEFFRGGEGTWFEQEVGPEDRLELACDGARIVLALDDIYEDTGLLPLL